MSDRREALKNDMRILLVDLVSIPVIIFWSGLSLAPLGLLFSGDVTSLRYWINACFLLSGFWGMLLFNFGGRSVMWRATRAGFEAPKRPMIASFGGLWCLFYIIFYFTGR